MEKTRLPIPAGLAEMPPGPELAAVLADIDLSRLGGLDCVTVMRAQHRQVAHEQARLMAAMVEVAVCGIGPDDALPRLDAPDEFSADEIRGALVWTRAAATSQLTLAWDLCSRLPDVFGTLQRGAIDVPKAKVFSEWTSGLTDVQAQEVCASLLPEAPELTTGQLTERIKRLAIAIDPDWARRRYAEAVRDRKVVGYRNEDGSANLCGYQLPADRAAAACANLDALAKKIKRAGDGRPIDHIRADLYLAMLDGTYTGRAEHDIIAHFLATAQAAATGHPGHDHNGAPSHDPAGDATSAPASGGQVIHGPWPPVANPVALRPSEPHGATPQPPGANGRPTTWHGSDGNHASIPASASTNTDPEVTQGPGLDGEIADGVGESPRPARRAGVEIRVELTTLLGEDDHPGEIAGWGFIDADSARGLVREQTAAEWRYAITDENGRLRYEGITRLRPAGYPSRSASPCRGGIVELHIKHSDLHRLAARRQRLGGWAKLIADLIRQADHQDQSYQSPAARPTPGQRPNGNDERGPRSPGKPLRRRTEIRDRTCTHPRCRAPAHGTDGDHTQDWAHGGATWDGNIGSACRHDHRLKHEGGWQVHQLEPGRLIWTSRLGMHYAVRPPLIIQPLPDPAPRQPAPSHLPDDHPDTPIWREPPASPIQPARPPPPPDLDEPVPF